MENKMYSGEKKSWVAAFHLLAVVIFDLELWLTLIIYQYLEIIVNEPVWVNRF